MFVTVLIKINGVSITEEINDTDYVCEIIKKLKWSLSLPEEKNYSLYIEKENEKENEVLPSNTEICFFIKEGDTLKLKEIPQGVRQC